MKTLVLTLALLAPVAAAMGPTSAVAPVPNAVSFCVAPSATGAPVPVPIGVLQIQALQSEIQAAMQELEALNLALAALEPPAPPPPGADPEMILAYQLALAMYQAHVEALNAEIAAKQRDLALLAERLTQLDAALDAEIADARSVADESTKAPPGDAGVAVTKSARMVKVRPGVRLASSTGLVPK